MEIKFKNNMWKGVKGLKCGLYEAAFVGFKDVVEKKWESEDEMEEKIELEFELSAPDSPVLAYKVRPFISSGIKPSKLYSFLKGVFTRPEIITDTGQVYAVFNALFGKRFMVQVGESQSGWNTAQAVMLAPDEELIAPEELEVLRDDEEHCDGSVCF